LKERYRLSPTQSIKESHALIKCPHCGGDIRVRARTLANETVEQAIAKTQPRRPIFDLVDKWLNKVFGKA